ncbi:MAG: hypothetical protein Q7T44_02880 [Parvibaculum sp.]|nr:hypothetical protein [Parvibaculum sp.]
MSTQDRPDYLASGEPARLIPTLAESSKEARITSVFLAGMMAVPPFGRRVLDGIGLKVGKTSRIQCYTEIVFNGEQGEKRDRPDGLILVTTGSKQWRAIIEAKSGNAQLDEKQIETYLEIGKKHNIDALITISNQLSAHPTHHPIVKMRKNARGPELFHWSWMHLLTEATLLISQSASEFDDPEQRYILSEVVRFFRHANSGITHFDRMNAEWKDVVGAIQSHATLSRTDSAVLNTVGSWHQEQRDICLQMSRKLGRSVTNRLSRAEIDNPEARLKSDCETLTSVGHLKFTIGIPDTAAPIDIIADLQRRNITCEIALSAPQDRKSTSARLNWLTKQLQKTTSSNVFIRATWPGRATDTQISLERARSNPDTIQNPNSSAPPTAFTVVMIQDLAGDFGRNVKFIERLEAVVPEFYEQVAQHLRAWVAAPPKISDDVLSRPEIKVVIQDTEAPAQVSIAVDANTGKSPELHELYVEANSGTHPDSSKNLSEREAATNLSVAAALADSDEQMGFIEATSPA